MKDSVYPSIKPELLYIPSIGNTTDLGVVYIVLNIICPNYETGIRSSVIAVLENGKETYYTLPNDTNLSSWAANCSLHQSSLFPCKVEFGKLLGQYYAEIL